MRSGQSRVALVEFCSTALRWMIAAALAALVHGAAAWIVLHHARIEPLASAPAAAALIELEPLAVAPRAPEQEKPPGPQIAEAQPAATETLQNVEKVAAPASEMVERQKDDAKTDSAQPEISAQASVEDAKRAAPAAQSNSVPPPAAEPELEAPKLSAQDAAEAVLPPPPAKLAETSAEALRELQSAVPTFASPASAPPETTLMAPKTPPDVRAESKRAPGRRVQRTKSTRPEDKLEPRRASAPSALQARLADVEAATASNAPPTQASSLASWEGELMAHLNRFKRFPPEAAKGGTAVVAFGVDRAGAIVSVRLITSAGDAALDRAAVGLLGRASPVPPPPASERSVVNLTVPIRFDR